MGKNDLPINAAEIISLLKLEPLNPEGGYYRQIYRSTDHLAPDNLPDRYPRSMGRSLYSSIYYLLTASEHSKLHRLPTDEIYHHYLGDPVKILQLSEDGEGKVHMLGPDLIAGQRPQVLVPKQNWQGSRVVTGGRFALLGTTMAPSFEWSDLEFPKDTTEFLKNYDAFLHPLIQELL